MLLPGSITYLDQCIFTCWEGCFLLHTNSPLLKYSIISVLQYMSAGCFIFARNFLVYSIFAWVRNWFPRPPLTTYLLAHLPALLLHYRQTTRPIAPLTMASFLSDGFCHYLVHYFYVGYYDLRLCTWSASFLSVLFSRTSLSRARVWSRSPGLLYDLRNLCSEFSTQPCHLDGTCFCQLNKILRILKKLNYWRSWHQVMLLI